ncbi:MAG: succinate dehydrogenase, hydrophobic membrane anchor protein [Alphaproteobacteria bacterium]|nr:succinate dehydrogenase, hydrophobic membrane anchor protein [Alphaproteobacteria bacterium]
MENKSKAQTSKDFRSNLSKARGLGSAHHGASHWWLQRMTALAILPLGLWFMYNLISSLLSPQLSGLSNFLSSPFALTAMVLFLLAIFTHAKLGLQVVIEDYVHGAVAKYTLLIGVTFLCYGAAALGILSVLKLHLMFD